MKSMSKALILVVLFLSSVGALIAGQHGMAAAAGQPTPSDDEVNAIARQLFCPVCENIPLEVCDTEACRQWRDLIRQQLAEGRTDDEIKRYFADHYGARVLSEPPASGFNWLAYLVPPAAFLMGIFVLTRAWRTWKDLAKETSENEPTVLASDGLDDPYLARLEEELQKRR